MTENYDTEGPVQAQDFPYDEIDAKLCGDSMPDERADQIAQFHMLKIRWLWQDSKNNPNGMLIRAIVLCWRTLYPGRPMAEAAELFGFHKQSLDRWTQDYLRTFPSEAIKKKKLQ